jgi:hypothetical protein
VNSDDMEYTEDAIDNMILEFSGESLYRSPGNKKKQLVLGKNYVLQW